jgi:hypothetical protein
LLSLQNRPSMKWSFQPISRKITCHSLMKHLNYYSLSVCIPRYWSLTFSCCFSFRISHCTMTTIIFSWAHTHSTLRDLINNAKQYSLFSFSLLLYKIPLYSKFEYIRILHIQTFQYLSHTHSFMWGLPLTYQWIRFPSKHV